MSFAPIRFDQAKIERFEELINEIIDQSDIILVILDGRMPEISRNKRIEEILREKGRKFTFVLNKIDIASSKELRAARKRLMKIAPSIGVSSKTGKYIDNLRRRIFSEFDKIKVTKRRCRRKVGLLGYPNVGKSSIINRLVKRGAAKVASEAGYTKGIHWIKGRQMELVDGPGYIESSEKSNQLKIGFLGTKNPEKLKDPETVAFNIIKDLLEKHPKSIEDIYKIKIDTKDPSEIISMIGKKRGHLKKGGKIEEKKTSLIIIKDWQSGKLKVF
ncbi:GTPase [Nanoarchaeota archaeon]